MEKKFLYRSAKEQRWLSTSQIQERINKSPNIAHELWIQGWPEWRDWRTESCFAPLHQQFPNTSFHYIGPSGRDYISPNEIIANIRLAPQKHHRIWRKGWKAWKHWFEEESLSKLAAGIIPKAMTPTPKSKNIQKKTISKSSNTEFGYDTLKKIDPKISFVGPWNLQEDQWMVLSQEDHASILDALQNSFPNLKWKENWIDNVICFFWTAVLDCCFGTENGNGGLSIALKQKGSFCLPKICSFYPEDPRQRRGIFRIKTSEKLQSYFSGTDSLPSFGDQSPFRNASIWSSLINSQESSPLSRRRRLSWVLHQVSGYDIMRITQIISAYERLMITQLKEKQVFELGDLGKLTLRKAQTRYHIGFVPSDEAILLVNSALC